ncbi:lysozyme [Escherichia coli]|uniref:lysozyme n=1 Tax=Escherichia coli TaxID=562 RepID=UPI001F061111|nr:lysozyme [Escherichia coli]MCH0685594.1 lysozyme [Escherichia coli]MDZ8667095.1 lysozyme [Escherichia coli]WRX87677.1 lysozyme [Escherichia coli]
MKTGSNGISLIKQFEGCKLKAYPDPATGGAPWTIGYGHTGLEVKPGLVWTQAQADAALIADLSVCENAVSHLVKVKITQNQFDALISFSFNLGSGNLASSTLLKKLNAGDYKGAADEFPKWNKAAGKVMNGLVARRTAERELFLK